MMLRQNRRVRRESERRDWLQSAATHWPRCAATRLGVALLLLALRARHSSGKAL
jgi:hypothetical protein